MKRSVPWAVGLGVATLAGCAARPPELSPMPVVTAPFAGKTVGACARQPLKFAADGVTAARGENMEFNRTMYRLRVTRRGEPYTMPPWGFALENAGEDPYFADAAKPIGAKLVFRGPSGAKGSVDVKVLSFFGEETFSGSFPFALVAAADGREPVPPGSDEVRFDLPDAAFRLKGANTIVATVHPTAGAADLRPFTDHGSGKRRPQFIEKLEARGFANPVKADGEWERGGGERWRWTADVSSSFVQLPDLCACAAGAGRPARHRLRRREVRSMKAAIEWE